MKRYLQRDRSQPASRYEAFDEKGVLLCRVKGKLTPSGEFIRLYDPCENIVCKIRRLGFSALSAYHIRCGGCAARLSVAVSAGRASARFGGISFCVRGDVLSGCYDIVDADGALVCSVSTDYAKGCVSLMIAMPERELFCLASAVCIDSIALDRSPVLQMT